LLNVGIVQADEKKPEKRIYLLWDGKETVAEYAKQVGLDPIVTLDLGDGVKMKFVLIPAGNFMMGSPPDEKNRNDWEWAGPQHGVTIDTPFYMGKFEVTQEQYEKLIKKNPSEFKGAKNPVENVCWNDAKDFCKKLEQKTSRPIRLPSEAEWEYACRAGSKTPYYTQRERGKAPPLTNDQRQRATELINKLGNSEYKVRDKATRDLIALGSEVLPLLDALKTEDREVQSRLASVKSAFEPQNNIEDVAWFKKNSERKTHPAGEKKPNAFGLHDMHGNVWEWCEDDWHDDYKGAPVDGSAWIVNPRGDSRVFRGGCWACGAEVCRSAFRFKLEPVQQEKDGGFRVVLVVPLTRLPSG
jgi:formylglycine-generating enzyme required for sulfatase activity